MTLAENTLRCTKSRCGEGNFQNKWESTMLDLPLALYPGQFSMLECFEPVCSR